MIDYQDLESLNDGDAPDQEYFNRIRDNQLAFNRRLAAAETTAETTRANTVTLESPFTAEQVGHLVVVGQGGTLATREDQVSYSASAESSPVNVPRRYSGDGVRATVRRTGQTTDGDWSALSTLTYQGQPYPLTDSEDRASKTATIPLAQGSSIFHLGPPQNTTIGFDFPLDLTIA